MRIKPEPLRVLASRTREIYENNAVRFDAERPKALHESVWLDPFAALLPVDGTVLDVGCGTGDPIAHYFMQKGFSVTGVDFSTRMLDLARKRFPMGKWIIEDMRTLNLGKQFDGIIGWNSFFHLTQDEQRATLARLAFHLAPNGALMLTVGPLQGEVIGHVGDEQIYHSSLSPEEYAKILTGLHIEIIEFKTEDPNCDQQTVLLARKTDTVSSKRVDGDEEICTKDHAEGAGVAR